MFLIFQFLILYYCQIVNIFLRLSNNKDRNKMNRNIETPEKKAERFYFCLFHSIKYIVPRFL